MSVSVSLYSKKNNEISNFLSTYGYKKISRSDKILEWKKEFRNPTEIADIIGVFIDNKENYDINMWISFDKNLFLNVTDNNANKIIRYLFERYPY